MGSATGGTGGHVPPTFLTLSLWALHGKNRLLNSDVPRPPTPNFQIVAERLPTHGSFLGVGNAKERDLCHEKVQDVYIDSIPVNILKIHRWSFFNRLWNVQKWHFLDGSSAYTKAKQNTAIFICADSSSSSEENLIQMKCLPHLSRHWWACKHAYVYDKPITVSHKQLFLFIQGRLGPDDTHLMEKYCMYILPTTPFMFENKYELIWVFGNIVFKHLLKKVSWCWMISEPHEHL